MKIYFIVIAVVAVMSIIAFFTYLADKCKAMKGEWRIKESVLITLGFFGGALGAILAMILCRHKIRKWYFWVYNLVFLMIHAVAVAVLYFKFL